MSTYERVFNFSAGPSVMPLPVLEKVQKNFLNYEGTGESVTEMSHRSKEYQKIIDAAEANLRELLHIPDTYAVLFLQGGATLQFSMVPLNLLTGSGKADYVLTGNWAKKAAQEAGKFGDIRILASSEDRNFTYIPKIDPAAIRPDADYVHICTNNTIYGSHYPYVPETGTVPLVADMSSCILSEEIDVTRYGLIYAGAQKNIAPAGVTLVIIRKDLIGFASEKTPIYLNYKIHADKGSMYNTPPCFSIYMAGEVFRYLLRLGGLPAVHQMNVEKAARLYDYIDQSEYYTAPVQGEDRSLMNVDFVTGREDLDKKFVQEARERGLINLAGHRLVGGMRASLYNAMTLEGVEALVAFMKDFQRANPK